MSDTLFNFLGIPEVDLTDAEAVILPVPFEETVSYGHGTSAGPNAIIEASQQVELYNVDLGNELQELIKITTVAPVTGDRSAMIEAAAKYVDKFLVTLGGEHSITPEVIKPFIKKYSDLSVLHIDAHTDMREEWEGSKNSHACAMRRVQDQGVTSIVQVGIRNTAKEEQQYLNKDNIFWGSKFDLDKILSKLSHNVYLSFDVDGLDAAVMPATGTPEPGGLSYDQAIEIIKTVAKEKNIVAADFMELAPIKNFPAYDFLVAKLIYELLSSKVKKTN